LDEIASGVPGQSLGIAAFDRHRVDVDIARVLAAERDGPASGEKLGFDVCPWKLVRRRASPPVRSTTQMLLAYANATCVALTDGDRSIRVGSSPLGDALTTPMTATGAISGSRRARKRVRRIDIKPPDRVTWCACM
jgi:hypothetical protein